MKTTTPIRMLAVTVAMTLLLAAIAAAQARGSVPSAEDVRQMNTRPGILEKVGIEQKLGGHIPLDAVFTDEHGQAVTLGSYFQKGRPVLLALVYYDCPMLCNQVLNQLTGALTVLKFDAGREFDVLAVSFDPRETPAMAAAKKKMYLDRYKRPGAEAGWHMLTGGEASIRALTDAVGFRYAWDEQTQQFAHGAGIILLTPEGKIAQYYYGLEYSPRDMRLGMIEATKEKIGTVVDQLILYCYHYDPTTGKYGAIAMNVLRLGAALTVLVLGIFLGVNFYRDARSGAGRAANP